MRLGGNGESRGAVQLINEKLTNKNKTLFLNFETVDGSSLV
jgi:hypothetical protein